MKALIRIGIVMMTALVFFGLTGAAETDVRASLRAQDIEGVRINLNPWGAHLGFETEVAGDDPGVEALAVLIREAVPTEDHKCSNEGSIRFRMEDGSVVGVGLLKSHTEGSYDLRLYDGDHYLAVYRVERTALLAAFDELGVPLDDPAFGE